MITIDYNTWVDYYNLYSGDEECPYDNVSLKGIDSKLMNKIFDCNNYVVDEINKVIKLYEHERYPKPQTKSKKVKANNNKKTRSIIHN